jgi:hypothetical protein
MKWAQLFRVFFPSWKFFDDLSQVPVLYFRVSETEIEPTGPSPNWTEALLREPRSWFAIFLNPKPGALLAYQSMLYHLEQEIDEFPQGLDFTNTTVFRLVHNLVQSKIEETIKPKSKISYQFKVESISGDPQVESRELVLLSPVFELPVEVTVEWSLDRSSS